MKSLEWQWSETKLAIYFALAFGIISLCTPMWGYCVSFSAGMILQAIINYINHKHGKDFYAANTSSNGASSRPLGCTGSEGETI